MFKICKHQLALAFSSPRIYIALIIGCIIQLFDAINLLDYANMIDKPLCIFENFIYFNCNHHTSSVAFSGILLLIADVPFTSEIEMYTLIRTDRKKWVLGKVCYLLCICFIYYFLMAIISMIYISENAYLGNFWSEGIYYMAKNPKTDIVVNRGLFFPYTNIITKFTPVIAFIASFTLSVLYAFLMSLMAFYLNLKISYKMSFIGITMTHLIGYFVVLSSINIDHIKYYIFGNSLLKYHNIYNYYGDDCFINLSHSYILFIGIIVILNLLIFKGIKKYDFKITIGSK